MKHTDETDPDVPEDENTEEPNEGVVERPEEGAVFEIYLKAAGSYDKMCIRDRRWSRTLPPAMPNGA